MRDVAVRGRGLDDGRVAFNGEGGRGASGRVGSRVRLVAVEGRDRCVIILGFTSKALLNYAKHIKLCKAY